MLVIDELEPHALLLTVSSLDIALSLALRELDLCELRVCIKCPLAEVVALAVVITSTLLSTFGLCLIA